MRPATLIPLFLAGALAASPPTVPQTPICGIEPFPPAGCVYICECDGRGACRWLLICNGADDDPDR